jgi:CxxC motif-containing protein (DUF1111 family)/erythromycin esterase-like protein
VNMTRTSWIACASVAFLGLCISVSSAFAAGTTTSSSDTDLVLHEVCGKNIAMLGESPTHGFGRTLEFKVALIRRLVDECHYKAFFIESGIYDFLNIEKKLKSGQDVTEPMIAAAIGGLWATREVQPMIPFLLEKSKAGAVVLGGLDDQLGRGTYAQRQMPADLVEHLQGEEKARCLGILQKHLLWQYAADAPYSPKDKALILGCVDEIGTNISKASAAGFGEYDRAMIDNLKRTIGRDFRQDVPSGANTWIIDGNDRDRSMYMNFRWLIDRLPAHSKVIVWAATSHVAKDLTGVSGEDGVVPFGSYVQKDFKSHAFALGFSAYSGSYARIGQLVRPLSVAPSDSLDARVFSGNDFDTKYLSSKELHKFGAIPARPLGADFKTAQWDEVLDGMLLFREERAPQPLPRVSDPGVRAGPANSGTAVAGVDSNHFLRVRAAFNEVHSIAGDIEPGTGLGPRFNGTSCGGCHAYPALGGASPKQNPQFAMGSAHGATNVIPAFLKTGGPIRVVRMKSDAGGVVPLFTVSGRSDSYGCAVKQPDFNNVADLSFRIPLPLFGAGLIENISLATILTNKDDHAAEKLALGISGRPNVGADGSVGKFGWKAQYHSLANFAADAYQIEMGVPAEASGYRRKSLSKVCYAIYEAAYDDPNFSAGYGEDPASSVVLFTEFMRFLKAPTPVSDFPGATVESVGRGRRSFESVGCALCHTPSLRTAPDSDLPALNGQSAQLFSDLLLHHMGTSLADGIVQGHAGSDEFRTAPLWGIGQRVFFLHDGRTADLVRAIEEHASAGSEANSVVDRFERLGIAEQQDVLNFLRSL